VARAVKYSGGGDSISLAKKPQIRSQTGPRHVSYSRRREDLFSTAKM
jgi:hypothetical protein